jgi:hypothetical protein
LYLMSRMGERSEFALIAVIATRTPVESKILAHGTLAGLGWSS